MKTYEVTLTPFWASKFGATVIVQAAAVSKHQGALLFFDVEAANPVRGKPGTHYLAGGSIRGQGAQPKLGKNEFPAGFWASYREIGAGEA